jgi:hypothetical protein
MLLVHVDNYYWFAMKLQGKNSNSIPAFSRVVPGESGPCGQFKNIRHQRQMLEPSKGSADQDQGAE